jgi:hypothetical protein
MRVERKYSVVIDGMLSSIPVSIDRSKAMNAKINNGQKTKPAIKLKVAIAALVPSRTKNQYHKRCRNACGPDRVKIDVE